MMHLVLSLGVQLNLKHVEAVVVLQVLCLRVTEHNDGKLAFQHGKLAFLQCSFCWRHICLPDKRCCFLLCF